MVKVRSQMRDVRRCLGAFDDGPHDLEAGGVAEGVDDAAMAVAALAWPAAVSSSNFVP